MSFNSEQQFCDLFFGTLWSSSVPVNLKEVKLLDVRLEAVTDVVCWAGFELSETYSSVPISGQQGTDQELYLSDT